MGGRQAHRVIEGEEAIAGQHGPPGPLPSCFEGQAGRANPVHLASANPQALAGGGHHDGVGAHVAHQAPGEAQVVAFGGAGLAGTHHLPAVLLGRLVIEVLHQQPAQQAAQLHP